MRWLKDFFTRKVEYVEFEPLVAEFDKKKKCDYIVSFPDMNNEDLRKFRDQWDKERKKNKQTIAFTNIEFIVVPLKKGKI